MASKQKLPDYGSLGGSEETGTGTMTNNIKMNTNNDADETTDSSDFDPTNTYYLKTGDESLSTRDKWRKAVLLAVPILAALIIVGGAGLFLARDFGNLYPGPSGGSSDTSRKSGTHASSTTSSSSSSPSSPTTHSTSSKAVRANPASDNIRSRSSPAKAEAGTTTKKMKTNDSSVSCSAHEACSKLVGDCCPTKKGTFLECCN